MSKRPKKFEDIQPKKKLKSVEDCSDERICLSISGVDFYVEKKILQRSRSSFFSCLVSGNFETKKRYEINRSPKFFDLILKYLKEEDTDLVLEYIRYLNKLDLIMFKTECEFYDIRELLKLMEQLSKEEVQITLAYKVNEHEKLNADLKKLSYKGFKRSNYRYDSTAELILIDMVKNKRDDVKQNLDEKPLSFI